jgi:RNA polymerase sigma factor (sigma-70 family)
MPIGSGNSKGDGATTDKVGSVRPLVSAVVLRSQTDVRLIALARDGHEQAFVAIAQRYRRELMAHARRMSPADRAEDVVQQAMLSAWSALTRRADVLDARAWLHRIVHNAALRGAQRGDQHDELDEGLAARSRTDTAVELRIDARDALAALADLPHAERRALELTALGDCSGRDAAFELGVSEGALRKLVHRARATLRAGIAALVPPPLLTWSLGGTGSPVAAHVAQLGAGAGFSAAVIKVGATVAVTASLVGGATQLVPAGHHRHAQPRRGQAAAGNLADPQPRRESRVVGVSREPSASSAARVSHRARAGGAVRSEHGQFGPNVAASGHGQRGSASQVGSGRSPAGQGAERAAGEPSAGRGADGSAASTEPNDRATAQPGANGPTGGRGDSGALQEGGQNASGSGGLHQP